MSAPPLTPARHAPARIQARRVLLLARLLSAMTATFIVVLYGVVEVFEHSMDIDIPFDQHVFDWRMWACVVAFWTLVMAAAIRPLRLHL